MANGITNTAVTVGNTSTEIIARGDVTDSSFLTISNDSDAVIYLALSDDSATAPTAVMNTGLRLAVNSSIDLSGFRGSIAGISAAGSKVVTVIYD